MCIRDRYQRRVRDFRPTNMSAPMSILVQTHTEPEITQESSPGSQDEDAAHSIAQEKKALTAKYGRAVGNNRLAAITRKERMSGKRFDSADWMMEKDASKRATRTSSKKNLLERANRGLL
eukprot:TRINITY_DN9304_c0_g1_i1.p1 TRINITY_DN9304_c0_g1~~TRINITY_DN9304_c0_g1_i1.p1  ORF type:complete len:120 (+),score=38.28 TRINITY_DN9304_c0_g1_i1:176-535(+)